VIPRRKLFRGLGVLTICVAVAACSSSSKKSTSSNTTASSSPASPSSAPSSTSGGQATGAAIKVGVICSCSGPFGGNIAPAANVVRAWAQTVNTSGGIDGHPVQLTVDDDASNPGTSVTYAMALINSHVDVILDLTVLDAAWASNVQAANMPVVGGNFSSTPFYTNPLFFPSGQTNDSIAYSVAAAAKAAGAASLSQFYCAEAPQCAQSVPLIKTAGQQLGVSDVYNSSISATAPNYTAQCVAAQQARGQALFIGHSSQVVVRVGQDCNRQNYNPIYVTEGTGYSPLEANAVGIKNNMWSSFPILPYYVNAPAVQAMNTALDKYYPGLRTNAQQWSEYAAQAWTAGVLIEHAVKASGMSATDTPSSATMLKGLTSIKGDNLDGWSPPLTFTAGQVHKVDCWFTAVLKNGTESLANNGQLTCQPGASA
jgi:branched-chain amino acid transport system substrate-binding protein